MSLLSSRRTNELIAAARFERIVWLDQNPARLPLQVFRQIALEPAVFVSAVTAWEPGIKQAQGKLKLSQNVSDLSQRNRFTELPVTIRHGEAVRHLPFHHRDPFDRLLVAQAIVESLTLVTSDRTLARYGVPVVLV